MENFDPNKTPKKQILSAQIDLSKLERATDEVKREGDIQDSGIVGMDAAKEYFSRFDTFSAKDIDWK